VVMYRGHVPWSRTFVMYLGHVPWSRTLVTYLGHVPWSRTVVTYRGHVPWSRTLVTYLGHVPWSRTLVTYRGRSRARVRQPSRTHPGLASVLAMQRSESSHPSHSRSPQWLPGLTRPDRPRSGPVSEASESSHPSHSSSPQWLPGLASGSRVTRPDRPRSGPVSEACKYPSHGRTCAHPSQACPSLRSESETRVGPGAEPGPGRISESRSVAGLRRRPALLMIRDSAFDHLLGV
jgi:hypothetical protein